MASIGLPAKGWLGVRLPAHTMWEHERKLYSWRKRSFRWDCHQGCWTVASDHFPRICKELLKRYPGALIGREFNPNERCNSSCQNARGFLCTCSCRAKKPRPREMAQRVEDSGRDLVHGARRVVVLMEHIARDGSFKIVEERSLALTGKRAVQRIITNLCVLDVTTEGLRLVELAPNVSVGDVRARTQPEICCG
ncbi:CoA-transferase [[Kitasatospora] papulosa]|uniref:Coenzyme A transferase n=1 Tax=Streptomyces pratensis (strain ATCC 33331 / IAF-45CD) TaxID=591167 RepID=A0A8D4BE64_STRFA